jgi:DNA-binding XRE family transcriptional regulator
MAPTIPLGKTGPEPRRRPIADARALGQIIRVRRRELGFTQARVADLCGVSIRFLSEVERGRGTAGIDRLLHVLATLSLDVHVVPRGA